MKTLLAKTWLLMLVGALFALGGPAVASDDNQGRNIKVLEEQYKAEKKAMQERHQAEMKALEDRYQLQKKDLKKTYKEEPGTYREDDRKYHKDDKGSSGRGQDDDDKGKKTR